MYFNNVETKPGIGYPKQWEDQDKYPIDLLQFSDHDIEVALISCRPVVVESVAELSVASDHLRRLDMDAGRAVMGTHNSPTRIHVKPTQMIGGYGQLSYGFNYYGPTGNQRDLNVVIRKLKEVDWVFILVLPLFRVADARFCFDVVEVHIFCTGTVCPCVFACDAACMAADAFVKVHYSMTTMNLGTMIMKR